MTRALLVTAAVIERDGSFLLTRRLERAALGGLWEFPGGKVEPGETLEASLVREIREELDATVLVGPLLLATVHDYPDLSVDLRFFRCHLVGQASAAMGQEMAWVPRAQLDRYPLPPADDELVRELMAGRL